MSEPDNGGGGTIPPGSAQQPSAMPPPPPNPHQPPPGAEMFPIVVHYNRWTGLGLTLLGIPAITYGIIPIGIVFVLVGVLYMFGELAIVEPNLVSIKSPLQFTLKKRPINGLGDLYFKQSKLYRRSDNKKIQNLGWGAAQTDDLDRLKQAVAAANPQPVR